MLSIPLFIKMDTCRHLVCNPTRLPAAMAQALTINHLNLVEFENCTPAAQNTK